MPATDTPIRHLEELLRVAHTADPKKINMDHWGLISSDYHIHPEQAEKVSETYRETLVDFKINPCGTTACLMGTAAFDPYFKAQGVRMLWRVIGEEDEYHGVVMRGDNELDRERFFDLPPSNIRFWNGHSWEDADDYLFMPHSYRDDERHDLQGEDLKAALVEHIERVLGYLKSPETTTGWRDNWEDTVMPYVVEGTEEEIVPFDPSKATSEELGGGTFAGYIDEAGTIGLVIHQGPFPEDEEDEAKA